MGEIIKTYFKDYVEAQKVCNEFNRKHWKGNLILCTVVGGLTYGILYVCEKHREKEFDKYMNEVINKE